MDYTRLCYVLISLSSTGVSGFSVVVSPSPTAVVVSGLTLSISCQWSADYTGPNAAVNYRLNDGGGYIGTKFINFGTACPSTPPFTLTCNRDTRTLGIQIPANSYSHGDRWTCEGRNNNFDNTTPPQTDTTTVYVEVSVTSVTITPSTTVTVDEGTSTTLTCTTQPYSRPTANVTWYQMQVVSGQLQQITVNISVSHDTQNSAQTTTSVLSYLPSKDSGRTVYCVSDGGRPGNSSLQSNTVAVNVRYRPAISIAPEDNPYVITEGQTGISLVCTVTSANPPVTSIIWTREVTEVSNTGVYNLTTITPRHSGEYTCSATNDVGTTIESITLLVISSPAEPNIVGITNVSSSSLTVKWSPNDKSSAPSTFNISHRCKHCEVPDSTSIGRITSKDVYSTTFTNLLPETLYYVNITAINQGGSSSPLDLIVATSPDETCYSSLKDSSSSPTALLVVGAILILISFGVLGFSIFLYRKSRSPARPVDQQEGSPKSVVFSSVLRSDKEREQVTAEENKSHYQELDPRDIQPPSPYESLPEGDDDARIECERNNYESLKGDPVKQDYEQLREGSKHYVNT
ncbi:nectin-3-like protein isoform X2 [Mizuhopecten yessoensis]|uniref:nectin-3-like protein isoform X2 n=1 Tax=Mizuhopecten yessoensis TaxID=6573 RepID=UPI000B458F80|nr:nectin-3-like protein isoform X2 [Mizuhopecten yessoensis]